MHRRNAHRHLRKSPVQRPLTYVDMNGIFLQSVSRLSILDTYLPRLAELYDSCWRCCQPSRNSAECLQQYKTAENLHACAREMMLSVSKANLERRAASTFDAMTRAACEHAVKAIKSGMQMPGKSSDGSSKRLLVVFEEALGVAEKEVSGDSSRLTYGIVT